MHSLIRNDGLGACTNERTARIKRIARFIIRFDTKTGYVPSVWISHWKYKNNTCIINAKFETPPIYNSHFRSLGQISKINRWGHHKLVTFFLGITKNINATHQFARISGLSGEKMGQIGEEIFPISSPCKTWTDRCW